MCLQDYDCSLPNPFICERPLGVRSSSDTTVICNDGYEPKFGRCYRLVTTSLTNAQASSYCLQEGGSLTQIRFAAERDYLRSMSNATIFTTMLVCNFEKFCLKVIEYRLY
jgi:hypothetical protein